MAPTEFHEALGTLASRSTVSPRCSTLAPALFGGGGMASAVCRTGFAFWFGSWPMA
jgi:hypothetical protein